MIRTNLNEIQWENINTRVPNISLMKETKYFFLDVSWKFFNSTTRSYSYSRRKTTSSKTFWIRDHFQEKLSGEPSLLSIQTCHTPLRAELPKNSFHFCNWRGNFFVLYTWNVWTRRLRFRHSSSRTSATSMRSRSWMILSSWRTSSPCFIRTDSFLAPSTKIFQMFIWII